MLSGTVAWLSGTVAWSRRFELIFLRLKLSNVTFQCTTSHHKNCLPLAILHPRKHLPKPISSCFAGCAVLSHFTQYTSFSTSLNVPPLY